MGHSKARKAGRKGASRSKLLPLPASMVQAISLQNHLALEALRSRLGESLHVTFLLRAVYLTYLLCDVSESRWEIPVLHEAEAALCRCNQRELADSEIDALKIVLTLHDGQLQSVSVHLYETACAHLLNYLVKGGEPIIPASTGDVLVKEAEFSETEFSG
ncbi:hypothetical protein [Paraburkholderia lycopersici]|uniref:Uncharacterized protein n=1 Tax=Paraburkholderia lycopersici TaxID=416944 RepID=A0A1G6GJ96_9BURK|nr:hypothetical protein [Paraburkholderia lycopersici]SDB82081.1 hypothetical protein SAMN05421548_1012 [Paraburkholderia lycopersici]